MFIVSRAPYDRFCEERSDTSKSSCLSGVRKRDLISWILLAIVIAGTTMVGLISPLAWAWAYLYAPEFLGLVKVLAASGMALLTAVGALRKLVLEIADRVVDQ